MNVQVKGGEEKVDTSDIRWVGDEKRSKHKPKEGDLTPSPFSACPSIIGTVNGVEPRHGTKIQISTSLEREREVVLVTTGGGEKKKSHPRLNPEGVQSDPNVGRPAWPRGKRVPLMGYELILQREVALKIAGGDKEEEAFSQSPPT